MRWKREQSEFSSYAKTWGTVRTFWRTLISRTYSSYNQKKPTPVFIGTLSSTVCIQSFPNSRPSLGFGCGQRTAEEQDVRFWQEEHRARTQILVRLHIQGPHASIFPEQTWMSSTTRLRIGHERTFCLMSVKKTILFHLMSRWKFLMWSEVSPELHQHGASL